MALFPVILSPLLRASSLSFSSVMWGWLVLAVLACICWRYTAPTMEEYRAQGAKVTDMPLPHVEDTTFFQAFWNTNLVVLQHWPMHVLAIIWIGFGTGACTVGASLTVELGQMLFGSTAAGQTLAESLPMSACISAWFVLPSFAYASDYFNAGSMALLAGSVMLSTLTNISFVQTTWLAQVFTCVCFGVMNSLLATYLTRYLLAFSGQARLGIVNGLCNTYASLLSLLTQSSLYAWISLFPNPSTPAMQTILPLEVASVATSSVLVVFSSCIAIMGLPDKPVK